MRRAWALVLVLLASCEGEREPAPGGEEISVVDAAGIRAALDARRGRPLLVNFWARWCTPCVAELPDLEAAHRRLAAAGGEVLGFAMDLWAPGFDLEASRRELPAFLAQRGVGFPNFLYGSKDPIPVLEQLDIPGDLPVTMAIDRNGAVLRLHEGAATAEELAELVDLVSGR